MNKKDHRPGNIDWFTMIIPLTLILALSLLFMAFPQQSTRIVSMLRGFLGDDLGFYYILLGLGVFACSMYIAFSKYGKIVLGGNGTPQYPRSSGGR
jgi:BCCT family betaine/carnitine transporter